jgi:hypothetical protein
MRCYANHALEFPQEVIPAHTGLRRKADKGERLMGVDPARCFLDSLRSGSNNRCGDRCVGHPLRDICSDLIRKFLSGAWIVQCGVRVG